MTAVEFLAERYNYITWMRNRDEISAGTADEWRAKYLKEAKEMEANAQLIAAAPEILKELIDFCKTFESTIGYQRYDHNVFVALNDRYIKSKKAINKALGL